MKTVKTRFTYLSIHLLMSYYGYSKPRRVCFWRKTNRYCHNMCLYNCIEIQKTGQRLILCFTSLSLISF